MPLKAQAARLGEHATLPALPAELKTAVELLVGAKSPLFIYGAEVATGERGRGTVASLNTLATVLGQGDKIAYVGVEANGQGLRDMGLLSDALPGHQPVGEAPVRERLGKLWGIQPPAGPGLSYREMLGGGVKALLVVGDNPAADPSVAEVLGKLEFLVVQDLFLTETAQMAEVVLPATSFAEADGTYTNLERRVQRAPQGIQAVGQSRPDWAIMAALAERWFAAQVSESAESSEASSLPEWKRKKRIKGKQGPAPKAWNYPNVRAVLEEIGKAVPIYATIRWDALGESGLQWPISALARPARRPELAETAPLPTLPAGGLWLVSGPYLWDGGLFMRYAAEQVRLKTREPFVALNPADLAAGGHTADSRVSVVSGRSTVDLILRPDASVRPGTAWVPAGLVGLPAELLGAGRGEPVAVKIVA